ncbi:hypothetical protein Tco_0665954 [Tanacetum coccineum]
MMSSYNNKTYRSGYLSKSSLKGLLLPQLVDHLPFTQEIMMIIKTRMFVLRGIIMRRARKHLIMEQLDAFDAWMEDAGTNDDEVPDDKISHELVEEMSGEIDEAKLQKDQMQNYLKNDIVWESRKERLSFSNPKKKAPVVQSCQRDPKAPLLTLKNQDLFYLKHGNLGPKKYILSLNKFPAVPFPDDDIEE